MSSRAITTLALALTIGALCGCNGGARQKSESVRPDGVIGFYMHDDPTFYEAAKMSNVPAGRVMHLGIEEGRWMMRDMMIGYGGTWTADADGAILTVTEGPTGKARGKEKIVAKRTDRGVTLKLMGAEERTLRFTFLAASAPDGFGYDEFLGRGQ